MKTVNVSDNSVRVVETDWIPLPDGVHLAARIFLPVRADDKPVPAILDFNPYRRHDYTRLYDDQDYRYLAGHGYAVVRVDVRGSGDSGGIMEDEYSAQEISDGVAVINWIARHPWCTGKVGMTGISWSGFNALQVAALRPEPLKAIITAASSDDRYADDVHYMGGCLITENMNWASTMFGFNSRPPDPEIVGEKWRDMWMERLQQQEPWIINWLNHQRRDEQWKHGSVCENYADIECAVYAVGGWADGYSNAVPRLMAGLRCPKKGIIGPWPHGWPYDGKPGPHIDYFREAIRWWDQWLKDEDTGIMEEPMLRIWMQESVPPKTLYDERPGRWVAETEWPPVDVKDRLWYLNHGTLDDSASSEVALVNRSPQTLGITAGEWCPYGDATDMASDQRLEDGQSLCFDSAPLTERLEILGSPILDLEIAVDRPIAFLAVRLNDVAPDGASTQVTYGLLNLTHDAAHETVTHLEPRKRFRARLQLNDIAHVFPTDNRIRVSISTSYWPRVWPSPEPVTLTVYTGASCLHLPARAPKDIDLSLHDMGEGICASPGEHETLRHAHRKRVISRDVPTGEVVIESAEDRGDIYLKDIDMRISAVNQDRLSISENDPQSAKHECCYDIEMARKDWAVKTKAVTVLTCTRDNFHVKATLTAWESEQTVFEQIWTATIPRDGN